MNSKHSVRRTLTALLMALITGLAAVVGAPQASAANRDWLRPDSTGHCEWDLSLIHISAPTRPY